MIGNTLMTPDATVSYSSGATVPEPQTLGYTLTQDIEILDGVLTLRSNALLNGGGCDGITSLSITRIGQELPGRSWFPAQTNPWMQLELDEARAVGLVNVINQPYSHCSSYWLYFGQVCRQAVQFDGDTEFFPNIQDRIDVGSWAGFSVRVSDTPCKVGKTCPGALCGTNGTIVDTGSSNSYIDCRGVSGMF